MDELAPDDIERILGVEMRLGMIEKLKASTARMVGLAKHGIEDYQTTPLDPAIEPSNSARILRASGRLLIESARRVEEMQRISRELIQKSALPSRDEEARRDDVDDAPPLV